MLNRDGSTLSLLLIASSRLYLPTSANMSPIASTTFSGSFVGTVSEDLASSDGFTESLLSGWVSSRFLLFLPEALKDWNDFASLLRSGVGSIYLQELSSIDLSSCLLLEIVEGNSFWNWLSWGSSAVNVSKNAIE